MKYLMVVLALTFLGEVAMADEVVERFSLVSEDGSVSSIECVEDTCVELNGEDDESAFANDRYGINPSGPKMPTFKEWLEAQKTK